MSGARQSGRDSVWQRARESMSVGVGVIERERQTDRQTYIYTYRQTDRQTVKQTDRQTEGE